ncbi:MAG: hypothetical protein ACLPTZ_13795 [Beijerinckiaceae bacterium]
MEFRKAWVTVLREAREAHEEEIAAQNADPWLSPLSRVQGKIDFADNLERVSSQTLLDILEVPQASRRAPVYRRIAKLMAELGWTPIRVRDLTGRGYKEQVRGYCRQPIRHS